MSVPSELECVFSLGPKEREQHSPAGEGMGGPNSDDWTGSLSLCIVCVTCNEKQGESRLVFIFLFDVVFIPPSTDKLLGDVNAIRQWAPNRYIYFIIGQY